MPLCYLSSMRAGTTKLDGWKITPVNFMLCTFGYLGSKCSGSDDVKPEKIAILNKTKHLHLALEVDKRNKMYNYFGKILFCESFRNGNSSAEPTVSAQPGGLRSRNRWEELICRVFWRRFVEYWQAQQLDTLRERWWKFVQEWYCSGLLSWWCWRFRIVL